MKKTILITVMMLLCVTFIKAQDDSDSGIWNELVITKSLSKNTDLVFGGRYETKSNNSETQEARGYIALSFKRGKWTFQPQYAYIRSSLRSGLYGNEHRPTFIINRKFQKKGSKWSTSLGLRTEFRIRPGKNDWRFVPTGSIERVLNKRVKFINRDEFWMDTRKADPAQFRVRIFTGLGITLNKKVSIEPMYLFQLDRKFSPSYVNKLVVFLRIKL